MASKGISQTAKVYFGMYKHIVELIDKEDFDESDRLASTLLTKADLPIIIRARCHMILATACAADAREQSKHGNFVGHADAAVQILEKARQQGLVVKDRSIEDAKKVQMWAKQSYQELVDAGAYEESDDEESDAEESAGEAEEPGDTITTLRKAISASVTIVEEAVGYPAAREDAETST